MVNAVSTLSAGDRLGNYQILGLAGAGGMGMVYRALDTKLERLVALKFLPDEVVASKTDKERFLREARTASSLDHPNIGVIHGIEETADGRTYIVMAFYEGETLARKISSGPLPLGESVDIAIQTARGLTEAHVRAVIHRDIKPSNIILTQQRWRASTVQLRAHKLWAPPALSATCLPSKRWASRSISALTSGPWVL